MSKRDLRRVFPGGSRPKDSGNRATRLPGSIDVPSFAFEKLFLSGYETIRTACAGVTDLGIAIFAMDIFTRETTALWVAARAGRANAAVLGRHDLSDLCLSGDPSLSLRHLALVVHPLRGWDNDTVRFRVIDLRTGLGFQDETGRRLEAVMVEGPVFLRCGRYALFCLITGDPTDWPPDGQTAWEMIPERVFLAEQEPSPWKTAPQFRALAGRPGGSRRSIITQIPSALPVEDCQLRDGEIPLGRLTLTSGPRAHTTLLGRSAAERGLLLGQYHRCEGHGVLTHGQISRVHLLIVAIDGALHVLDTSSTNGTWHGSRRVRLLSLEQETMLILGGDVARVRWAPT